jgi:carbon-monoxide dehydrogenase medium subunit
VKPPPFEYHRPETVPEALALLREHGDEAKVIAGGQSLVPLMALRLARPAHLIDLERLDLGRMTVTPEACTVGATVTQRRAELSVELREACPVLADALPLIAHVQIRNRGTIGGSLAHADPAGELPLMAVLLDAEMVLLSERGTRRVGAAEFFQSYLTTALLDDELLVEVRFPAAPEGSGWGFEELSRRHGDFALVSVGVQLEPAADGRVRRARIALGGVDQVAVRATEAEGILEGAQVGPALLAEVAALVARNVEPPYDLHGSSEYRRHLTSVLARRALETAAAHLEEAH